MFYTARLSWIIRKVFIQSWISGIKFPCKKEAYGNGDPTNGNPAGENVWIVANFEHIFLGNDSIGMGCQPSHFTNKLRGKAYDQAQCPGDRDEQNTKGFSDAGTRRSVPKPVSGDGLKSD